MAISANNTPMSGRLPNHLPADPVAFAIGQHRRAYAAWLAARDRLHRLQTDNALDDQLGDAEAIREALTTIHGPHAPAEIAIYFAAEAAANAAAQDEDEAWRRVESLPIGSREDLTTWLSYVQEHASREQAVATLGTALRRVGEMLAERLAA